MLNKLFSDVAARQAGRMDVRAVIEESARLYSLPEICLRLQELIVAPETDLDELSELIMLDPALTSRLLKLANSSFYSFSGTVETVRRAVHIIGLNELYNLVLASSLTQAFSGIPPELIDMSGFWLHSVNTGLLARELGRTCGLRQGERLFVAGLLHDIGKLALITHLPELTREAITLDGYYTAPWEREQLVLGYSFAEVGAELLKVWDMPEPLWELVACQHAPHTARHLPAAAALVHIASRAAAHFEQQERGVQGFDYLGAIAPEAWRQTGLSLEALGPARLQMDMQALDVLSIIAPKSANLF